MNALIRTARPKQWTKNVLVFAAPGAAGVLDEPRQLGLTCLAFVAMCLASSGTYYWNDALDIESDREHPTKRFRPIASGFVLRAAAGAVAVDVPMSSWFVLCITFGALFIVTGKRFAESRELGADAHKLRATLGDYSEGYLRFVLALACGGALVSYCMWAFERRDIVNATNHFYELTIVPVLTAFLRYALILEQGRGAAPEEVFASDRVLQILGALWVIVFGLAVYT